MPTTLKRLPGTTVSDTLYEAVRAYAYAHDISKAEAVRQLLESSPLLNLSSEQADKSVSQQVGKWGGNRQHSARADNSPAVAQPVVLPAAPIAEDTPAQPTSGPPDKPPASTTKPLTRQERLRQQAQMEAQHVKGKPLTRFGNHTPIVVHRGDE